MADLFQNDQQLTESIIAACQQEAAARQTPDPAQQDAAKLKLEQIGRSIEFTIRNVSSLTVVTVTSSSKRSFRVGRADLRGSVWFLSDSENGRRHRPRVGAVKQAARKLATQVNMQLGTEAPARLGPDEVTHLLAHF